MPKTNHPNTRRRPAPQLRHRAPVVFFTDRQRKLHTPLPGAPCPASDDDSDADRLTLLGYGGAPPLPSSVCGAS